MPLTGHIGPITEEGYKLSCKKILRKSHEPSSRHLEHCRGRGKVAALYLCMSPLYPIIPASTRLHSIASGYLLYACHGQ